MFLLEQACRKGYDYYHLLSGADLPLKTNVEIHRFFEQNKGKEFISYSESEMKCASEIRRRTRLYHFLQNYRRAFRVEWVNVFFTFCERVLLVLQIILRIDRTRNLDWSIQYGSQWFSITDALAGTLLGQKEKIEKIFSYTNCSDELFVQTVAYNCGFRDSLYSGNMRLIDWERGGNGNPYTWRITDFEMLRDSDMLFARKFSEIVDKEVIMRIVDERKM